MVCILDADKEGYLRSETSLIQTAGRAARHAEGRVVLFCDEQTKSIQGLVNITDYRRAKQIEHNEEHGITPQSVKRAVQESLHVTLSGGDIDEKVVRDAGEDFDIVAVIKELQGEMQEAASKLEFEKAALLRDQIGELKAQMGEGDGKKKGGRKRKVKY